MGFAVEKATATDVVTQENMMMDRYYINEILLCLAIIEFYLIQFRPVH